MEKEIKTRQFRETDLPAVFALIQHTIEVTYAGVYPAEAILFFKGIHSRENILSDTLAGYTVVAACDGTLCGTGTLLGTNIRRVFISPDYQHRGIGKNLVRDLAAKASQMKLTTLDLEASLVSRKFWESRGFTVDSENRLPVGNNRFLDYFKMFKNLA
jgi:N-acetylglutamate synthase-like GNAT family acetyltransferase